MANHSVFLPGEPHGQRSLAGYGPEGHKESETTEQLTHVRNRFSVKTRRRKWGKFFRSWRREERTNEASETAVQSGQEIFGQFDGESWNYSCISGIGLFQYFCYIPALAEICPWGVWPWDKGTDVFRETGSEAISQLCSHSKSPESIFMTATV